MRWYFFFTVLVVVLGAGGFWYYTIQRDAARVDFTLQCVSSNQESRSFLEAVRSNDVQSCNALGETSRQRCLAFLNGDASMCDKDDLYCVAVASRNVSLCADASCRAQASGDVSYCDQAEDRDLCRNFVSFNAEFFARDEESCRLEAEKLI
jgi:hypothetical protein